MQVFLFIEHYPNPYKPWIDTQIVQMLKLGHDVRIFALGSFTSTIHDEVREFQLSERTSYYPATLKGLARDAGRIAARVLNGPRRQLDRALSASRPVPSQKERLLVAARSVLLPDQPPDVCYIHNLATASTLTFLRRLYPHARICLYFHGGEVGGQPQVSDEARIFDAMHAVIVSTRFAGDQAIGRGCDPRKIAVVPLGFALSAYQPRSPRVYRPDGLVRFVSVGRMSPEKGFVYALQAVKALKDQGRTGFTYRLIGKGIQYDELVSFSATHGLGDVVQFAGEKTRAEVAHELENADALILPSIVTDVWAETQATVIQEALLLGCLTVVTAAGGVPESNAPAMRRFSVTPGDPAALMGKMAALMSLSAEQMAELGADGRRFAVERYGIQPLMERILAHAQGALPADHPAWLWPPANGMPPPGWRPNLSSV